ncbi:flagellar biosynthesis protein FlhF [Sulfuriflexus sp.]|uniref:flagellar biosynthesis protein FlhF n=1 Tax=Sulfuriflexus sp. TaxID=2015443 RepID=UPI0028CE2BC4|nr:flagellar biosynthesis protein FlhF [Sulfuriflexus sp.]MDT8403915.1 flagellar biosynthesis protein FlhF [Sulfuriflexus sp.]
MKIKRFFARDISGAIRSVREELGPDAVILSNLEVNGGIEIVAATDYDEALFDGLGMQGSESNKRPAPAEAAPAAVAQPEPPRASTAVQPETASPASQAGVATAARPKPAMKIEWSQEPTLVEMRRDMESLRGMMENRLTGLAWGEQARLHPQRTRLLRELMNMGLSPSLCRELTGEQGEADYDYMWRESLGRLAHRLPVSDEDILDEGGVIALLGPTGVGKTTTIAKLAARYALRHGSQSVALVTTDSYRIGAHEQLRIYGRILNVPVRIANDGHELRETLNSLQDKRLVLIDTAGMSQRDVRLSEQIAVIHDGSAQVRSFLVLSATTQYTALDEAVKVFAAAEPEGCFITKTDEASSLGPVLSVAVRHKLPVAYVADGQRVPEDLRLARAHNLVKQAMELKQSDERMLEQDLLAMATERQNTHVHG